MWEGKREREGGREGGSDRRMLGIIAHCHVVVKFIVVQCGFYKLLQGQAVVRATCTCTCTERATCVCST